MTQPVEIEDEMREWIVTATITLAGAYAVVRAKTQTEAEDGAMAAGFETNSAELIDWHATKVEINE